MKEQSLRRCYRTPIFPRRASYACAVHRPLGMFGDRRAREYAPGVFFMLLQRLSSCFTRAPGGRRYRPHKSHACAFNATIFEAEFNGVAALRQ